MTLSQYLFAVKRLPRPSDMQIEAFVEHVASAHSWYKHLPLLPPGVQFLFYLNPDAGREWIRTTSGGAYRDRTSDTPQSERFHYTWQPTTDYIERFGYLDYFADAGTSFLVPAREGVLDTRVRPRILDRHGQWIELPDDIRAAGAAQLTAVIHPLGREPAIWLARLGKVRSPPWEPDTAFPEHPPEDELLATILELLRQIPVPAARVLDFSTSKDLETKWFPAYAARQLEQMRHAIRRMLQCIFGPPGGVAQDGAA